MDLIVKMKLGAHLYGTATSDSDVDYKDIFMPTKDEVLLGRIPKGHSHSTGQDESKNTKNDIDVEIYSFHYFIKLACDGQTVAMDMLHAPEEMLLQSSNIWKAIIKNRHRFYTKNLKSFIDYARRQASKYGIKGSRINAALQIQDLLKEYLPTGKIRNFVDKLIDLKGNDSESTKIERSSHFEDYMDEEFKSLDAKIPKNPGKVPIKEFDCIFKDILEQINK